MVLALKFNRDTDARLMQAYGRGDAGAFEKLYRRHKDGLYRFFLRQCGNTALAEELFQDVWVRVIDARERYEPKAKFSTWLYHIAHNILVDHYRKPVEDPLPEAEVPSPRPDNPETIVSGQEKLARYRAMIRTLPDEQREVFLLKEEAGMSLAEIAGITGENFETVKSRLRYAAGKLKQALAEPAEPGGQPDSDDGQRQTQAI